MATAKHYSNVTKSRNTRAAKRWRGIELSSSLIVGARPSALRLARLAAAGCRIVVDLTPGADGVASKASQTEADYVRRLGMQYRWRPLSLDEAGFDAFKDLVVSLKSGREQVYLHCDTGVIALTLGLIASARATSLSHLKSLSAALGKPLRDDQLTVFVRRWFEAFTPLPDAPHSVAAFD